MLTLPSESPGLNRNLVEALHLVLQDDDHVHRTGAVATAEAPHTVALNDAVERRVALGAHGSQGDRLSFQMRFFRLDRTAARWNIRLSVLGPLLTETSTDVSEYS